MRSGLNPETTLISGRFYCYDDEQTDLQQPEAVLDVNGNNLSIPNGTDTFLATLQPGSRAGAVNVVQDGEILSVLEIEFNEFGQIVTTQGSSVEGEGCYQSGAAHDAAMHQFSLNTPDIGDFQCTVNGTDAVVQIELLPSNRYRFAGETGDYLLSGITTRDFSRIGFLNGSLQGVEAEYYESSTTGIQILELDERTSQVFFTGSATFSSSQLALCQHQSEPKPFKLFGPAGAPTSSSPEVSLSGLFFINTSVLTTESRSEDGEFIEFRNSGYTYIGSPFPGGTNCSLTNPNGLPLCDQYQFDGSVFSLVRPWGETIPLSLTTSNGGVAESIEGNPMERVSAVDPASLIGTWVSQDVDFSGFAACSVGVCSSSITDRVLHFRADGRFLFEVSSDSSSSFDVGNVATFSNSNSNDEGTGSYAVSGNSIALTSQNGRVEELSIYVTQGGNLALGTILFSRP